MAFVQWGFLACLLCFSVGLETPARSCDKHDLLALKEFAGNLTKGSIITEWSDDVVCCKWIGVYCDDVLGLEKEQNMNQRTCAWVVSSIQIQ